jgi:hypothetical protein
MVGPVSRTPLSPCPVCDTQIDAATAAFSMQSPNPGDFSICVECGAVLRYDGELQLRWVSWEELEALPLELFREIAIAQQALFQLHRKR